MADREKVIEGLERCMNTDDDAACIDCPYNNPTIFEYGENICLREKLMPDAVKLLKEQEPIEPTSYMDGLVQRFACGKCGKHLLYAKWGRDNFCSKCGQAVKWE